jgi:hypothetical protein
MESLDRKDPLDALWKKADEAAGNHDYAGLVYVCVRLEGAGG